MGAFSRSKAYFLLTVGAMVLVMASAHTATAAEEFKWRFGIYFPSIDSLEGQRATAFVDAVAKRSDNRLQIEVFPGGVLGYSSFTHHRVVGDGLLEMGTTMSAAMIEAPEWETLSHVLLFKTREDAQTAWRVALPDLEKAALRNFNSKVLGALIPEFDHMFSKVPLRSVDDWKGHKFRAWQKQLACWFDKMGATPMVIPYHETYTALATGVVEGNSGMLKSALDVKLYEVMEYVSTGWKPNMPIFVTLVNEEAWNALPADLQEILAEEGEKYFTETSDVFWNAWPESLNKLEQKGLETVAVSPEELQKGRALARACWEDWMSQTTPEAAALMKKIMSSIGD
jgi:TRAP-type C4-dicarboxylate transport system substrate-binding protein